MSQELDVQQMNNWQTKTLLIGAVAGAAIGALAAYMFINQTEKYGTQPEITTGDGVRLGVLVLGLLRQVAALGEGGNK